MLNEIEQRLNELVPDSLSTVGAALSLAAAMEKKSQHTTAAYIVPIAERPQPDPRTFGSAKQLVDITFGVVTAVRVLNDTQGQRALSTLEALRQAIRGKLFGWLPEGAQVTCQLGAGDLIKMDHGQIWWLDRFHTQIQRRQSN